MCKDFLISDKLFYDEDIAGTGLLTQEELEVKNYIELKNEMENLIEREHYIRSIGIA